MMSEEPLYMDRPTANRLLGELEQKVRAIHKEANLIRCQYLNVCGKTLEGKYFRDGSTAYFVERAQLPYKDPFSLSINLVCCKTNSRGEATENKSVQQIIPRLYSETPLSNTPYYGVFEGMLSVASNGEEDVLFCGENILAEDLQGYIRKNGSNLTVRYWIADQPLSPDQLNENFLASLYGAAECDYSVRYSEYTGYLGTDEEINVGGHDLLAELKGSDGKFLRMEVEFDF
jgi:hypothetical protein